MTDAARDAPKPGTADRDAALRSDDPFAFPFWEAARRGALAVQRCDRCGHHQFYPRPFCLACDGDALSWVECSGKGTVHSVTTVHVPVLPELPELPPPYQVALVDLAEGPRLLATLGGPSCRIGDAVELAWRERPDAPPMPCFRAAEGG